MSLLLFSSLAQAQLGNVAPNQVVIRAVAADATHLYVEGLNFGPTPLVFLGGFPLGGVTANSAGTQIVALVPPFPPGTYLLHVSKGNGTLNNATFNVTLGAAGPVGPEGPRGDQGLQGRWNSTVWWPATIQWFRSTPRTAR